MYNTKRAVSLYVEAATQNWSLMEHKVRQRSVRYETSTAVNPVPHSCGLFFLSRPSF